MGKIDLENNSETSKEKALGIIAIDKDVVHKICSGQVVLTLAVAVKELIENSLDAGATAIEIRLVDQGSTLVEIADNGSGIKEDDFQGIALKHHTSKLSSFLDLESIGTFGFRGEALSSLCSLCGGLSVLTCHASACYATSLEFDSNGILTKKVPCARQVGTTVTLKSLFSGLPVRRKEFVRHLQREFVKMTHLLYAYCLVSTGVRITCTNRNQLKGNHSSVVVATQGGETIRDNIACIFGQKQVMTVLDFKQKDVPSEILEEFGLKGSERAESTRSESMGKEEQDATGEENEVIELTVRSSPYNITGCISTCEHGKGRGAPDRQFFFINSRPCEPVKVMRLINEVYHQFNSHQYPFVFMDIRTDGRDGCGVDVNVTPDKRKIFIENEKLLLATMKASLVEMFASTPRTFHLQNLSASYHGNNTPDIKSNWPEKADVSVQSSSQGSASSSQQPTFSIETTSMAKRVSQVLSRFSHSSSNPTKGDNPSPVSKRQSNSNIGGKNKQPKMDVFCLSKFISSKSLHNEYIENLESPATANPSASKIPDSQEHLKESCAESDPPPVEFNCKENGMIKNNTAVLPPPEDNEQYITKCEEDIMDMQSFGNNELESRRSVCDEVANTSFVSEDKVLVKNMQVVVELDDVSEPVSKVNTTQRIIEKFSFNPVDSIVNPCSNKKIKNKACLFAENIPMENNSEDIIVDSEIVILDDDCDFVASQKEPRIITSDITLSYILQEFERYEKRKNKGNDRKERKGKFIAGITPKENKNAETELQREITKDMFAKMKVIGQFNLGFIVTKLGSDLFIVDQHASDEKYNFETLQLTTNLQQQPLVVPQPLDLTAAAKAVLAENTEVFECNGFRFAFPSDNEPGDRRVCLTSIPYSRNWTFGKEDVDELIFMLQDSPHTNCRPSRVRDMFALRACRKSVMIGTALNTAEMRRLIDHMGLIEQPWNCPHGRPTMRHLINLDMIISD